MQVHEDERKSRHRSKLALFQGFPDTSKLSMLPETRKSILDDVGSTHEARKDGQYF